MMHSRRPIRVCPVCKEDLRIERKPPYCSKKCEASVEGYGPEWIRKLKSKVEGTTAFRPMPLDPVEHIISALPIPVISDPHAPIHSKLWLYQVLACADVFKSEICILNGDVLDLNEISRHMGSYYRRRKEMGDDFDAAELIFNILCERFKTVYWLSGNHCLERLLKLFGGELNAQRLSKLIGSFPNLKVTSRSFLDVNNNTRIGHPRQYSRIRGALAQRLAMRWQKNIGLGHEHHDAMSFTPCGKYQAVSIPSLADTQIQDYVRNEINDFPEPMNGFAFIFGDWIQNFNKHTPWKLYGLPELPKDLL